ncbi:hypothetical protein SAMN06309944_1183 [Micrococcales bacterium KH10]|nr:hypothetical protein SAMN06309944_1183 [Micrococcales bacterium KH10]
MGRATFCLGEVWVRGFAVRTKSAFDVARHIGEPALPITRLSPREQTDIGPTARSTMCSTLLRNLPSGELYTTRPGWS